MTEFFDPDAATEVRRRSLPHWNQRATTYFVTFRLADSLPARQRVALETERKQWLALNPPPHNEHQASEFNRTFTKRIHQWLDAGYGSCILARQEIFTLVEGTLKFFDGQRYLLGEHIVMPNHVHALVEPLDGHDLSRILHTWKSYSAHQMNKMTGSRGPIWHRESFDHIVRSPRQLDRIEQYIRDNPKSLPMEKRKYMDDQSPARTLDS